MGIFHKLQGILLNRMADSMLADVITQDSFISKVEPIIELTKTLGVHQDDMVDLKRRRIVFCYFFGFIEILADHQHLNENEIMPVTARIFRSVFGLNEGETENAITCIIDASNSEDGRNYIHTGAVAVADFLEQKSETAVLPLTSLLEKHV